MTFSVGRNVYPYDPKNLTEPPGGLVLCNGVTSANFYAMVEIFVDAGNFILRHQDGDGFADIEKDEQALQPGNFFITIGRRASCIHGQAVIEFK